jgi:hypothetical protein
MLFSKDERGDEFFKMLSRASKVLASQLSKAKTLRLMQEKTE